MRCENVNALWIGVVHGPGAFSRSLDLGIARQLIGSTLRGFPRGCGSIPSGYGSQQICCLALA